MNRIQTVWQAITGKLQFTEGQNNNVDNLGASLWLLGGESTTSRWRTYDQQVEELDKRYNNRTDFGSHGVKTCVDYRASWIAGNGAQFSVDGAEEQEFLNDFITYNFLDSTFFHEIVTEGEIEGKSLLYQVAKKEEDGKICIDLKHLSWIASRYHVHTRGDDYEDIIHITKGADGKEDLVNVEYATYVKLGGSRRYVNDSPPRLSYVLWNLDSLDRAMDDLRRINHKFGAAFPYWETSGDQGLNHAQVITNTLRGEKASGQQAWRIGHSMAAPAKFYYGEPSGEGAEMIQKEIIRHATIISSASGVPIHFLGYVELMSNRATAQELTEQINATTGPERIAWAEKLEEIAKKAFLLYNATTGKTLNPDSIKVTIPAVSIAQVEMLMSVYFPLNTAGKISDETLLERVPGVEPKEEQKRLKKENAKALVDAVNQMKAMGGMDEKETEDEKMKPPMRIAK